jgi:hypothetical protein
MAQVVSGRPLTAKTRVRARYSPCKICGGRSGTGKGFSQIFPFSPLNIIPLWFSILVYNLEDEQ